MCFSFYFLVLFLLVVCILHIHRSAVNSFYSYHLLIKTYEFNKSDIYRKNNFLQNMQSKISIFNQKNNQSVKQKNCIRRFVMQNNVKLPVFQVTYTQKYKRQEKDVIGHHNVYTPTSFFYSFNTMLQEDLTKRMSIQYSLHPKI